MVKYFNLLQIELVRARGLTNIMKPESHKKWRHGSKYCFHIHEPGQEEYKGIAREITGFSSRAPMMRLYSGCELGSGSLLINF